MEWFSEPEGHHALMVHATAGLNFAMDVARYVKKYRQLIFVRSSTLVVIFSFGGKK